MTLIPHLSFPRDSSEDGGSGTIFVPEQASSKNSTKERSAVMFKKKKKVATNYRKRENNDDEATEGVSIPQQKEKRRRSQYTTAKDEDVSDDEGEWSSSRTTVPLEHRGGAFAEAEIDAAPDRDARALYERKLQKQNREYDKTYQGQDGYRSFVKLDSAGANKYTGTKGPIRAPQFVRNTCRFDYQPDICKDYKETGFCGYGDSCKFMHDRGDYKTGWQLEQEFKFDQQRQRQRMLEGGPDEEDEDEKFVIKGATDDLPFACHICREAFKNPMETLCGHYFCMACIQSHFRDTSTRCPICEKQTSGVLNKPTKLLAKAKAAGGFDKLFQLGGKPPS